MRTDGPGIFAPKRSEMPSSGCMRITSTLRDRCSTGVLRNRSSGGAAELDRDLGDALRQALAGAQVERHVGPAPVVDRAACIATNVSVLDVGATRSSLAVAGHRACRRSSPAPYWPRTVSRQHALGRRAAGSRAAPWPSRRARPRPRTTSAAPSRRARAAGTGGSAPCRAARRPCRSSRRAPRRRPSRRR